MNSYKQVVSKAIQRGIPQEIAEDLAMKLYLQGALDKESLVESVIRMTLITINNNKKDSK